MARPLLSRLWDASEATDSESPGKNESPADCEAADPEERTDADTDSNDVWDLIPSREYDGK